MYWPFLVKLLFVLNIRHKKHPKIAKMAIVSKWIYLWAKRLFMYILIPYIYKCMKEYSSAPKEIYESQSLRMHHATCTWNHDFPIYKFLYFPFHWSP